MDPSHYRIHRYLLFYQANILKRIANMIQINLSMTTTLSELGVFLDGHRRLAAPRQECIATKAGTLESHRGKFLI